MKTVIWHQKTWMWKTVSWVQTRLGSRCVKNCRLMLSFSWSRKPIIPTLEVVTTLHAFQWISLENFLQCQMLFLVQKTYVSWLAAANANCSQLGSLIDWTRLVYQPDKADKFSLVCVWDHWNDENLTRESFLLVTLQILFLNGAYSQIYLHCILLPRLYIKAYITKNIIWKMIYVLYYVYWILVCTNA